MINDNQSDEEMPKLNIEDENAFKKLKLGIEHNAIFNKSENNIPPEMESQFLDNIIQFEEQMSNAKKITIYEKLGKPYCKTLSEIKNKQELKNALEAVIDLMNNYSIGLNVICTYENQDELIYSFIIDELFAYEMNDYNIPGMFAQFIYEEFHPNHRYDLENDTIDFIKMFLNKGNDFYEKFHGNDAENHIEINRFRNLFQELKLKKLEVLSIDFDELQAKTTFKIKFTAKQDKEKLFFEGDGFITFEFKYGFWYVKAVQLPIKD